MNLDEKQKQQVVGWLNDGSSLAEIQKRLESEFEIRATYMEVKFLVSDLDLTPKDPEPDEPEVAEEATEVVEPADPVPADSPMPDEMPTETTADDLMPSDELEPEDTNAGGDVSVTVDQIARPGAMISGKVTFSNGKTCEWMLDQMGRIGVVPAEDGYKPSQADLQRFQLALQDELKKMGY